MLREKLTMIINSCDRFSDLWDAHTTLLNRYWPDREIETHIVTDAPSEKHYEGMDIFSAGEGAELSRRLHTFLPHVKTDYVLLTLDDYFLTHPVSSEKIQHIVECMELEKLDYVRLFKLPNSHKRIAGCEPLYHVNLYKSEYAVNLYVGIWRKSFLEEVISQELNAWKFEVSLTKSARKLDANCAMSKAKEFHILDVVRKGQLLHKANRYLKKHGLYHGSRTVIPLREEFRIFIFTLAKRILPQKCKKFVKKKMQDAGAQFYS